MCGICGLWRAGGLVEPHATVAAMTASLGHRGPDAQGTHVDGAVALGSTRLAILDLRAAADMPIYNEDGSVAIVYNGEVYNYRELRATLDGRHEIRSDGDTEVIVHLYEEHGIDMVERLNGMFAFALWDARTQVLHLARDRFGQKPLYLLRDGDTLAFGSELKALLGYTGRAPRVALDALVEALTFQNVISDISLAHGVELLPPGSVLSLGPSGQVQRRYFDPLPAPVERPRDEVVETVRDLFDAAMDRHLRSDVEIASYLSGGLDTGAITATAARTLGRLTTFCAGFDVEGVVGMEASFDEMADARELATTLGTHHKDMRIDAQDMEMVMGRLVHHLEEPRMNFSYPNYLVSGIASRWVKVVLSGAGGDELFGGYPWRYRHAADATFPDGYYGFWTRLLTRDELARALTDEALREADLDRPRAVFDAVMARSEGLPALDRILYFELSTYLPGLLHVEDKLSMAHALETRVPFLDADLVDYALTVPAATKLAGDRSKDLWRRAMSDRLPPAVVERGKTGFTPPQAAWFRGANRAYIERVLLDRAADRGMIRPAFLREVLDEHASGRRDRHHLIWTLLCIEWWQRIFVDGEHTA